MERSETAEKRRHASAQSHHAIAKALMTSIDKALLFRVSSRLHRLPHNIMESYHFTGAELGTGKNSIRIAKPRHEDECHPGYAVRSVDLTQLTEAEQEQFANRVVSMLDLDHPCIAHLVDVYIEEEWVHLVVEHLRGGELLDELAAHGKMQQSAAQQTMWHMLLAVNHMHQCGYVHFELKLDHFLYEDSSHTFLKLIDFGHVVHLADCSGGKLKCELPHSASAPVGLANGPGGKLESEHPHSQSEPRGSWTMSELVDSTVASNTFQALEAFAASTEVRLWNGRARDRTWSAKTRSQRGRRAAARLRYMAPEVARCEAEFGEENLSHRIRDFTDTRPCDMWSMGVVAYVLVTGQFPFKGNTAQEQAELTEKTLLKWPRRPAVSSQAMSFIGSMLVADPSKRATAAQALRHTWLLSQEEMLAAQVSVDRRLVHSLIRFSRSSVFRRVYCQLMAWSIPLEERLPLRQAFLELDLERRGAITLQQFSEALSCRFRQTDDTVVRDIFAAMDVYGTQEIRYTEFLAAMVYTRMETRVNIERKTFDRLDKDGDEVVMEGELRSALTSDGLADQVVDHLRKSQVLVDGAVSYEAFVRHVRNDEQQGMVVPLDWPPVDEEDDAQPQLSACSQQRLETRQQRQGQRTPRSFQWTPRSVDTCWGDCCVRRADKDDT